MKLSYLQISMQLYPYVEMYKKDHPEDTSLNDVISNVSIYKEYGAFVRILCTLLGNGQGKEYKSFDRLCQSNQAKRLEDMNEEDANALWEEFQKLFVVKK